MTKTRTTLDGAPRTTFDGAPRTTVVGAGIAGWVAAIELAEAGCPVDVLEARSEIGGRGRSGRGPYAANEGPHALYLGGDFEAWLRARGLMPEIAHPPLTGVRLLHRGKLRRVPFALLGMARSLSAEAPDDLDYRTWAHARMSPRAAEAAIGFASLPTFHGDPGALSAAFVHERIQRSMARPAVGYVVGGWSRLIDKLAGRALELGVRLETDARVTTLPAGPCIVATPLRAAARLLDDPSLTWPGPRTATLDVALEPRRGDPAGVLDIDARAYVARYTATDPSMAPAGQELVQAASGLRDGERLADGLSRIHAVLDLGYRHWRDRKLWEHTAVYECGAGAADPPGTTWRDRPAIERGGDRWLAGDQVAAPGVLSEVSCASGSRAAQLAIASVAGTRLRAVGA